MPDPIKGIFLGAEDEAFAYTGDQLLHNLLLFGRLCRGLGMDIDPDRMIAAARALEYIDLARRSDVYHALRAVIVTRQRDIDWFDQAFREFWRRPSEGYTTLDLHSMGEQRYKHKTQFLPPTGSSPDDEDEAGKPAVDPTLIVVVPTYSTQA